MGEPKVTRRKLADFQPAKVNPNKGTPRGLDGIEQSVGTNGFGRPMFADRDGEMLGGSHTIQALVNRGFEDVYVIESDGSVPIIHQRTDVDIEDPRGRSLQIADNRLNEIGYDPDDELLAALLADIGAQDAALVQAAGFEEADVRALMESIDTSDDDHIPTDDSALDIIYPTDNEWGIPVLLSNNQPDSFVVPAHKWGVFGRKTAMAGTYYFYTEDYKFLALFDNPHDLIDSGCRAAVEVNLSTDTQMPRALVMTDLYHKRWLSRYWQSFGVRLWVDVNVEREFFDLNMIGVPKDYRAFANRAYSQDLDHLSDAFEYVVSRQDTRDLHYLVIGGRESAAALCQQHGWIHVPEQSVVKDKYAVKE